MKVNESQEPNFRGVMLTAFVSRIFGTLVGFAIGVAGGVWIGKSLTPLIGGLAGLVVGALVGDLTFKAASRSLPQRMTDSERIPSRSTRPTSSTASKLRQDPDCCGCGAAKTPDLALFLQMLSPRHIQQLAEQCELRIANPENERLAVIRDILSYLKTHPERQLSLGPPANGVKRDLKLKTGATYMFGLFGASMWNSVTVKATAESITREVTERNIGDKSQLLAPEWSYLELVHLPWSYEFILPGPAMHTLSCGGPSIELDRLVIPAETTFVTDVWMLRCGELRMGRNSKLLSTCSCGFTLMVRDMWNLDIVQLTDAPRISTSIRDLNAAVLVSVDDHLWELPHGEVSPSPAVHGQGWDRYPRLDELRGLDGSPGFCTAGYFDWGTLTNVPPTFTPADDGESHASVDGLDGFDGMNGGSGFSPPRLRVEVESAGSMHGPFCFETCAGNGGPGQDGQDGQNLRAGKGGNLDIACRWGGEPGHGGAGGVGGNAGAGGRGGDGGDGGDIVLRLPDGSEFVARTRGGRGGEGGKHGSAGAGKEGEPGQWVVFGRAVESPPGDDSRRGRLGSSGSSADDDAVRAHSGTPGFNGEISINDVVVVPRNTSGAFRYPPLPKGARDEGCWIDGTG